MHFVLPLENISPEEAVKAFTTVIMLHAYGAITPMNNTSNIINEIYEKPESAPNAARGDTKMQLLSPRMPCHPPWPQTPPTTTPRLRR